MLLEEYTGLFEQSPKQTEQQTDQQTEQQTEQQPEQQTEVLELKKLFDEMYKSLQSRIDTYITQLKEIEQQQQDIRNKIIQQYKQTLSSTETDDKIKSIIFKGVR